MGFLDCFLGIIPARAGFTKGYFRYGKARWDHPRSRGVYSGFSTRSCNRSGSSPLARGLRQDDAFQDSGDGIIPARAGFTTVVKSAGGMLGDHPRSRGVYPDPATSRGVRRGSSPLARGLPRRLPGLVQQDRIIPARAGFTEPIAVAPFPEPDHPRSRGVYSSFGLNC